MKDAKIFEKDARIQNLPNRGIETGIVDKQRKLKSEKVSYNFSLFVKPHSERVREKFEWVVSCHR